MKFTLSSYLKLGVNVGIASAIFFLVNCAGGFSAVESFTTQSSVSLDFSAAKSILTQNCDSCHDGSSATKFNFQTEKEFITAGLIVPGNPDGSLLIRRLKNFTGTTSLLKNMPTGGELTEGQYQTLRGWVLGADSKSENTNFACNSDETVEQKMVATSLKPLSHIQLMSTLRDFISVVWTAPYDAWIFDDAMLAATFPLESDVRFPRASSDIDAARLKAIYLTMDNISNRFTADDGNTFHFIDTIVRHLPDSTCTQIGYPNMSPACRRTFIKNLGILLYRRPLLEVAGSNELDMFLQEFDSAANERAAANNILMRMLMSQNFLFHMEDQETVSSSNSKILKLSSFSVANRLSYSFWNTMPDKTLLQMAMNGGLEEDTKFVEALAYVMASTKLESSLREFTNGWLLLKRVPHFDANNKGVQTFNEGLLFDDAMRTAMISEAEELVSYVTKSGGTFTDLFTTDTSFARYEPLMKIYGVTTPAPATITSGNRVRLPAGTRSGILTRAALLADGSAGQHPIKRAVFVKRDLMCANQLPPPADTSPLIPLTDEQIRTYTQRQQIAHITGTGSCLGCHQTINQFGYPLSRYNGLGFYKLTEPAFDSTGTPTGAQLPVDSTASLNDVLSGAGAVTDGIDYSAIIGSRDETQACFTKQYANYFLSRLPDVEKDGCRLIKLNTLIKRKAPLKDAFRALATDVEFRLRKLPD